MEAYMADYMESFIQGKAGGLGDSFLAMQGEQPLFFDDVQLSDGLKLKQIHTYKVVENCQALGEALHLSPHDLALAKMIGLFHDIGRFTQFVKYRTFNDALSENHGALGVRILHDIPLMKRLDPEDLKVLKFAIANHNARVIGRTDNKRAVNFARLIRDCDKVDIYRVLKPFLGPTDGTGCSPDFVERFVAGKQCDYTKMRTQDDRKVVRLMWIYDINFTWSLKQIIKGNYIEDIIANLVHSPEMEKGFTALRDYVAKRLQEPDEWYRA